MMRNGSILLTLAALLTAASCTTVQADSEVPCWSGRAGEYQVAVFQSPSPLRVGRGHFSLLVQDAATHAWLPSGRATLHFAPSDRPQQMRTTPFSPDAADNRLLQAATFELTDAGPWDFEVVIDGPLAPAGVRWSAEVATPPPAWAQFWPWWSWPAVAIALFAVHQLLVNRAERHSTRRQKREGSPVLPGGR